MTPWKHGKANRGHSCVKGRFAWGYATHQDRILQPMIRESITDPWEVVTWDEAIAFAADKLRDIQQATASRPSAASPPRAAPTRRPTSSRR
jgi:formate dehydrogenase major subunit